MQFSDRAKEYAKFRKADERLVQRIIDLMRLPVGSTIAEIGAGTGNYSKGLKKHGFNVYAVEPCLEMCNQCQEKGINWIYSYAHNINLSSSSVDGVVVINAIHHFEKLEESLKEIYRIIHKGPLLIITFDPEVAKRNWWFKYWPKLKDYEDTQYLKIYDLKKNIQNTFHNIVEEYIYKIPYDFNDVFSAATWKRPYLLLNPEIRDGMSIFASLDDNYVNNGIRQLERDLKSGKWDEENFHLLKKEFFDVGCRIIRVVK